MVLICWREQFYIAEEDAYCSIEYYTNGQYRSRETIMVVKLFQESIQFL